MAEIRTRGVRVVVDTTHEAEWDIRSRRISDKTLDAIARKLKLSPFMPDDTCIGSLRVREIENWDIGFTVSPEGEQWVVTIWGVEAPGELEELTQTLIRAGKAALPEPVQVLLEGRKKDDV